MDRKSTTAKPATAPVVQPRLLSIKQAAAYLNCTVWATRSLAWGRELPFLKIGNRILFDKSDLDAFVDRQKSAAAF